MRNRSGEIAGLLVALLIFCAARWPLLAPEGQTRGWTSDSAVVGLAGKRALERHYVNIFFWGQNYLGPLTSLTEAGIAGILLRRLPPEQVWPLALRLASMTEVALGIVFFWLGLRLAFGRWAAFLAALWMAIGPAYLFGSSLMALADEVAFLCAGILFWLATRCFAPAPSARPRDSAGGCFLLGLASGFGWWMHQGVVLVLVPAAVLLFVETNTSTRIRQRARLWDRLLVRREPLVWTGPSDEILRGLRMWNASCLALLGVSLLGVLGAPIPVFGPEVFGWLVALLTLSHVAFEAIWGDREAHRRGAAAALGETRSLSGRFLAFAAGALAGYAPVIVGKILHWYTPTYGRRTFPLDLRNVAARFVRAMQDDVWGWVGIDRSVVGKIAVAAILACLCAMAVEARRRGFPTARPNGAATPGTYAGAVVAFCLAFDVLALRGRGPVHYLSPGVAAAYGLAAAGLVWLAQSQRARGVGVAGAAVLAILVLGLLAGQARAFIDRTLAEPDPRGVLARIEAAGYRICYANYWDAYKLQFLSEENVSFIPYKNRSRNPSESQALAASQEEKCLLLPDGSFRPFRPDDNPTPIDHYRKLQTAR